MYAIYEIWLVRTITCIRFELKSPNLHQICIMVFTRLVLKMGFIELDLQGHWPFRLRIPRNVALVYWFMPAKGCYTSTMCYCILHHYCEVIMATITSQITSHTIVYSTVHSGADQRKHQSSASLAFVRGIHRWPVNSLHKSNTENVSIWWRHRANRLPITMEWIWTAI